MKIVVDAYGGDNAPLSVLQGAQMAVKELGHEIILSGKEAELREVAAKENISLENMSFIEAENVMPVEDDPSKITKDYKNSSLAVAIKAVAEGLGDAVVSAGSTGAIVVGAIYWVKRIKGIKRPAIGVIIPNTNGIYMLIDGGANSRCRPEMLMQFGVMGSVYMEDIIGIENPRVGMVNIGTEPNKGLELQIDASALLENAPVNFIGNVEAKGLPTGGCDVAVTDGFTGNIILKHTEGMAKMMKSELKEIMLKNAKTKLGALMLKDGIKEMSLKLDPSEYGGVALLGVTKPVVKAHGSSDAKAIKNAIKQAGIVVDQRIIEKIEKSLGDIKAEK